MMGLGILVIGLMVFLGSHLLVSLRGPRAALIARVGEGTYKGLFSLVSIVGLALVIIGFARYRSEGLIAIWSPPVSLRHLSIVLMWPAFICVAAAYIPGKIKQALKHPMLVGIKLWAFGHLLANGDLGGIILFGSILGWAVYDRISLKGRTDPGGLDITVGGVKNDVVAVVVGTVVYLAVAFVFHPLAGLPVFTK
jgi:uncharacterized membrane protein